MISWLTRKHRLDILEQKLREVAKRKAPLNPTRKNAMKKRVINRIDEAMAREEIGFEQLAEQLEKLQLTAMPSPAFKKNAREDLVDMFTLRTQRLWLKDLFGELLAKRRLWATVVTCSIFVTGTFGYFMQMPQVSAAKVSQVDAVRGTVFVEREGRPLGLENGFLVKEGDRLITEGDGWMDVMFVDDSLLTLGPNTIVEITQLWVDPENEASTSIEVDVLEGRTFAQVINLSPTSSLFNVSTEKGDFTVNRKANFDVFVSPEKTELRVFSNLVDFAVSTAGVTREGTLGPNLMMELNGDLVIEQIENVEVLKTDDVWVQTNLENHNKYLGRLQSFYEERTTQQAGTLPGDSLYFLERGGEELRLLFSFGDENSVEANLAVAEQRFSEATVLMRQGDKEAAQKMLLNYQETLVGLSEDVPAYEQEVRAVLQENKKMMEGFSVNDSIQEVRDLVEETAVLVINDEAEKQVINLETTADRLGLALDFIQIGAYDLAEQSLQDYQTGLSDVLAGLAELPMESRKQVIFEILDQKLRDLLVLKMIVAELDGLGEDNEASVGLRDQVEAVYTDTLYQLNVLVLNLKERAVLQLGTFLEDVKADETMQLQILGRLKKSVPLDFEFMQVINDLEEFYGDENLEILILEDGQYEEEAPLLEEYVDDSVEQTGSEFEEEAKVV